MGTDFTARLKKKLCQILEVNIDYDTDKHSQTIGSLERTDASLKKNLGIYENHIKRDWHNYVHLIYFLNITSNHSSSGCTPTFVFHGRESITPFRASFSQQGDTKFRNAP